MTGAHGVPARVVFGSAAELPLTAMGPVQKPHLPEELEGSCVP